MVYLAIKEMANISEDVIIVTSSLTKDMTGKEDMYRASAIRTLCKITDVSNRASPVEFNTIPMMHFEQANRDCQPLFPSHYLVGTHALHDIIHMIMFKI